MIVEEDGTLPWEIYILSGFCFLINKSMQVEEDGTLRRIIIVLLCIFPMNGSELISKLFDKYALTKDITRLSDAICALHFLCIYSSLK